MTSVVSPEVTCFPCEALSFVQEEATVTIAVESNTLVVVVQFKVSSPPSHYQVTCFPARLKVWITGASFFCRSIPLANIVVAALRV